MNNIEIYWDEKEFEYYTDIKIDNQILHMAFEQYESSLDTVYFNIYMTLYSKRKDIIKNEEYVKSTGKNPMKTIVLARRAFDLLENECIRGFSRDYNVVISCWWLDNKRQKVYERILTKKGYKFGFIDGQKVLFKKIDKQSISESEEENMEHESVLMIGWKADDLKLIIDSAEEEENDKFLIDLYNKLDEIDKVYYKQNWINTIYIGKFIDRADGLSSPRELYFDELSLRELSDIAWKKVEVLKQIWKPTCKPKLYHIFV